MARHDRCRAANLTYPAGSILCVGSLARLLLSLDELRVHSLLISNAEEEILFTEGLFLFRRILQLDNITKRFHRPSSHFLLSLENVLCRCEVSFSEQRKNVSLLNEATSSRGSAGELNKKCVGLQRCRERALKRRANRPPCVHFNSASLVIVCYLGPLFTDAVIEKLQHGVVGDTIIDRHLGRCFC